MSITFFKIVQTHRAQCRWSGAMGPGDLDRQHGWWWREVLAEADDQVCGQHAWERSCRKGAATSPLKASASRIQSW